MTTMINVLSETLLEEFGEWMIEDIKLLTFYLIQKLNTSIPNNPMSGFSKHIGNLKVTLVNDPTACSELNLITTHGLYECRQVLLVESFEEKDSRKSVFFRVTTRKYAGKHTVTLENDKRSVAHSGTGIGDVEFDMAFSLVSEIPRIAPQIVVGEVYSI